MSAFDQKKILTPVSKDIKVYCEVEKIWILYDRDYNGTLDFEEIVDYLKERAYPHLKLSDDQLHGIMDSIDTDGNGTIDRQEMERFLHVVLDMQKDISFTEFKMVNTTLKPKYST